MRSAIYYPRTEIRNENLMKSSLLLWDRLHTIVPDSRYKPRYDKASGMAEAWELIGKSAVPDAIEQTLAHRSIKETLEGKLPKQIKMLATRDARNTPRYEIYPQKLAIKTWEMLQRKGLTADKLPNGDYPFTHEGGVLVMSKLADAMAGDSLARMTDQSLAFGFSAERNPDKQHEETVLMTLDVVDCSKIPMTKLIEFRKRELTERRGFDYTEMRYRYADAVEKHVKELRDIKTPRLLAEKNADFESDMRLDLAKLRDELTGNKVELVLKPVIVATLVAAGTAAWGLSGPAALLAGGTAAFGSSNSEIAEKLAKLFEAGFGFSKKQRDAMAKHPMAYMYQLARA